MPGTPATSPLLGIPRYANSDVADFALDVNAIVDQIEASVGGRVLTPIVQAANYPAAVGDLVLMSGARTVTLPTAPANGKQVGVVAISASVTIVRGGTDTMDVAGQIGQTTMTIPIGTSVILTYQAGIWYALQSGAGGGSASGMTPVTAAKAYRNAALTMTAGAFTKIPVDAAAFDAAGNFDVATNRRYNVPVAGQYQVNGVVGVTAAAGDTLIASIYVNGVERSRGGRLAASSVTVAAEVSDVISCNAGDYIELWGYTNTADVVQVGSAPVPLTYLSVVMVGNVPAANSAGAGVFAAHSVNAQLGTAAAAAKVALNTVDYDLSGWFDTTNRRFTPTQPGYYHIDAGVNDNTVALASGDYVYIAIYKNGAALPNGVAVVADEVAGGTFGEAFSVGALVYLNGAGDYVELWGVCTNSAGAQKTATFMGWMTGFLATSVQANPTPLTNTAARAYLSSALTPAANTWTKIPVNVLTFDKSGGSMDVTTNRRYNVGVAGTYRVTVMAGCQSNAAGQQMVVGIYKNGALWASVNSSPSSATGQGLSATVSDLVSCVAGDYLEAWVFETAALLVTASNNTSLSVNKVDN